MEASSGVVLRQTPCFSSSAYYAKELKSCCSIETPRRLGFYDKGQLQYYYNHKCSISTSENQGQVCKEKKLKKKKKNKSQTKLLKGLARDLSAFSKLGFGLDSEPALIDQIKGNIITEATDQLLEQLQHKLKEKKELKRKKKEEKIRLKSVHMQNKLTNREMSSSSSSSSSDSECGEVIDMIGLKRAQKMQNIQLPENRENPISTITLTPPAAATTTTCNKKIEVCMGGKCKKSGAGAILEEFEKVVGVEGAVSSCKCMGKCSDGPNVRVVNSFDEGDCSVRGGIGNVGAVCVRVGLEDVNMIVDNFVVGEKGKDLSLAAAA